MKVLFLHLSDMHFVSDSSYTKKDCEEIANAVAAKIICPISMIFLVLSGDIAFSGGAEEYNEAEKFVGELQASILGKVKIDKEKIKVLLVPGNHDKDWDNKLVQGTFIVEQPITVLKIDGRKYVLSHFPMADWQSMSHESIHLHGHIHSEGSLYNEMNRMQGLYRYDVGVDANGYSPVSMEEILAWFDGVECRGRVKWKDWVDETGDKKVRRKLAGL